MRIAVLCVGRLKESYYADAVREYVKRIGRFMPIEIIEVPDLPEQKGDAARIIETEGKALLEKLKNGDYVVAMCVDGQQMPSEKFADELERCKDEGVSRIVFVIGGSLGLSDAVVDRARRKLSLSMMTFPHQLARVVLTEQIYRALKISAGERYHK